MAREKITLATVAADAGVSKSTVSLVVRESPLVSDETRAAVLASIERLGYVYNRAAAGLRSKRTGTIGLIVSSIANLFFAEAVNGAEARVRAASSTLLFTQHSESIAAQRRQIEIMLESRVAGVLLVPAHGTPPEQVERLRAAGVPVAVLTRRVGIAGVPYIGSDNRAGGRRAGEHLLDHGSRQIAFVGGVKDSSPYQEREEGLIAAVAMSGSGAETRSYPSPPTREAGYEAVRELLKHGKERPDAIFAYNDNIASGVMAAVTDSGMRVGVDVRVIGFDDIAASRYMIPALTTVNSRPGLIGTLAVETLFRLMDDPGTDHDVVVPNSLSVRASCGCSYEGTDES